VTAKGEVLWKREIPGEVVYQLCQQADKLGCGYGFGVGPIFYANEPLLKRFENDAWNVNAQRPVRLGDWTAPLLIINHLNAEMEAVIAATTGIEVKRMIGKDDVAYVDITQQGVTKALGVAMWAELNGLNQSQLIGVGDGLNDMEFLQSVGWAVAMENAVPAIKAIANQVIGHANDDGLAIFIESVLAARKQLK
jgi:hydroxymethylpyrimidine pyrophosphatase-like HAD family hydrolase